MGAQPIPQSGSLRAITAAEVRAELAKQNKTRQQLARALGISPQAMSRRTTGELPFDIDELEAVAGFLNVPITQLLGLPAMDKKSAVLRRPERHLRLVEPALVPAQRHPLVTSH